MCRPGFTKPEPEPDCEVCSIQRQAIRLILKADVIGINGEFTCSSKTICTVLSYRSDLFLFQPNWVIKIISRILSRALLIEGFNYFFASQISRKSFKLLFCLPEFGDFMVTNHSRWFFDLVTKREPLVWSAIIEAEGMAARLASLRDEEGRTLAEVAMQRIGRKPSLMRETVRILKRLSNSKI